MLCPNIQSLWSCKSSRFRRWSQQTVIKHKTLSALQCWSLRDFYIEFVLWSKAAATLNPHVFVGSDISLTPQMKLAFCPALFSRLKRIEKNKTAEHLAAAVRHFQSHQVSFFSSVCQVPGTSCFFVFFSLGFSHPDLSAPSLFFLFLFFKSNVITRWREMKWGVCVFLCPSLRCSDCPAVVWQEAAEHRLCYLWCCLTLCFILISMFFLFFFFSFLFLFFIYG